MKTIAKSNEVMISCETLMKIPAKLVIAKTRFRTTCKKKNNNNRNF